MNGPPFLAIDALRVCRRTMPEEMATRLECLIVGDDEESRAWLLERLDQMEGQPFVERMRFYLSKLRSEW